MGKLKSLVDSLFSFSEGIAMTTEYDVVVVGAGILGLATAYHIKRENPDKEVLVVEKRSAAGQGNTAKSAAMFRCFFYSNINLLLTSSTVDFYQHLQEELNVDLKIRWTGYLWLFSREKYEKIRPVLAEMSEMGLEYKIYETEELENTIGIKTCFEGDEEAKLMGLEEAHVGIFIPKAGSLDVDALVNFYASKFVEMGGKIQFSTEVKSLIVEPEHPLGIPGEPYFWQNPIVRGVHTNNGSIKAKTTVLAAGAWIPTLLDQLGIECYIKPKKRQIFCVKASTEQLRKLLYAKDFGPEGCIPFTILPKPSVYFKPAIEEEAFWISYGDEFPRAFLLEEEPQPEENFYEYGIYQVLVKYFPQFMGQKPYSAFAGLYAINTLDGQPLIFKENGLIVVGGASGSGIMKADAIGRIAAALYKEEEYAELFGGKKFRVSDLGLKKRRITPEKFII